MDVKFWMNPEVMKIIAPVAGGAILSGLALGASAKLGLYTAARVDQHFKKHSDSNNNPPALSASASPTRLHLNIDIPPQSLQGLRVDTFTRSKIN